MNQTELNKIIKEHKLWLVSNGTEGKRADLREAYLRGANLEGVDLKRTNLGGANLRGANLRNADLRGVDLEGVDLWEVDLEGADLRGANLNHCFVSPNTKILGNVLITEFYKQQYSIWWEVKSWVGLDEAGLAEALYL